MPKTFTRPTPEQLRQARRDAEIKVARMARLLGVTRATIYNAESGEHQPHPNTAKLWMQTCARIQKANERRDGTEGQDEQSSRWITARVAA